MKNGTLKKILKDYDDICLEILKNKFTYNLAKNLVNFRTYTSIQFKDANKIYIDVSIFAKIDNKTGIQRVIREILYQFLEHPILSKKIVFIIATKKTPYSVIKYDYKNSNLSFEPYNSNEKLDFIKVRKDEVFFGVDFCPNIVSYHIIDFIKWRLNGAKFVWIVHDILPITNPEWFTTNSKKNFLSWFKLVVLISNTILCVSNVVKKEILSQAENYGLIPNCEIIPLGYSFHSSFSNISESEVNNIATWSSGEPYILIVSTLEPRKGYKEIIENFTHFWMNKITSLNLIIVGKQGWNVDSIIRDIEHHYLYNKKLFWLNNINDTDLLVLYNNAQGTIVPSLAEGYGLPLIEAIFLNKQVLVRDIPIFREVGANKHNLTYFKEDNSNLLEIGTNWLTDTVYLPTLTNQFTHIKDFGWYHTFEVIISLKL